MADPAASNMNTLRLICFAMSAGMLIFAAVTIFLTIEGKSPGAAPPANPQAGLAPMLLMLTGAVGLGSLAASVVIQRAMFSGARAAWQTSGDVEAKERTLWSRYSSLVIARTALAESFGLLGIVALFLGGPPLGWFGLAAPLLAIGAILIGLPSQSKYEEFLTRATAER